MLHSYVAEIDGSELVWVDAPPVPLKHQRVLIVVEDVLQNEGKPTATQFDFSELAGRLQWRGDAVAAQRASRDAW
ncbi:MAG: hypothetical protein IPH35_26050 [Rhodoferax sp.]|nr:hypothetical protein [Rhodoferax sp.]